MILNAEGRTMNAESKDSKLSACRVDRSALYVFRILTPDF
jgi:hypothetical protein